VIVDEFLLQPYIYSTNGKNTLLSLLEQHWIENVTPGNGTIYLVSGFGNYNGGVRFYDTFREHIALGGRIIAIFGGSTSQKLTSKELVEEMLGCGAEVIVLNRKRIMHAKCFGYKSMEDQSLVVTSGNFTGPGMSQNVEAALGITNQTLKKVGFDWEKLVDSFTRQTWDMYKPSLPVSDTPEWKLLYKEAYRSDTAIEDVESNTMLLLLGHADTARISAEPGSDAGKGSQYFWLSKDAFDFFPPLTVPNRRGVKPTYSAIIKVNYIDLGITDDDTRVTFEAGNNVDFRLGTGPLRYTRAVAPEDMVAISRRAFAEYDLKVIKKDSQLYNNLKRYLINYIGNRGKMYGYIPNDEYDKVVNSQS
jgi:hypothetical protein